VILQALGKTAIKWLLIVCAFIALLSVVNWGLSFVPFTPQFNAKRTAAAAERLEVKVSTLEREAAGNAEIATATETFHTRELIIREGTAQAIAEARSAPDATTPLATERADRLRSADFRLCDQFPGLCADADAAGSRPDAVPPAGPAG
jgi:biopolymer transport protein ExbB/TolQ